MELILELMSRVIDLTYDVNQLMRHVDGNVDSSFLDGAEKGLNPEDYNLPKGDMTELFNKRKAAFQINNRIVFAIQELSSDEKSDLAIKVRELMGFNKARYVIKQNEYQQLIDTITKPEFSFEGNEEVKERIVDLKEEYSRYQAAALYFENMYNYLKTNVKQK